MDRELRVLSLRGRLLGPITLANPGAFSGYDAGGEFLISWEPVDSLADCISFLCDRSPEVVLIDLSSVTDHPVKVVRAVRSLRPLVPLVLIAPDASQIIGPADKIGPLVVLPASMLNPFTLVQGAIFAFERQTAFLEAQLAIRRRKEAENIKAEILSNISHEFRTPLNGIIGNAQLGLLSDPSPEFREMFETIESRANVMLRLIDGLMAFTGRSAHVATLDSRDFRLAPEIQQALAEAKLGMFATPDVRINIAEVEQLTFHSDPSILRLALRELIGNAIKFGAGAEVSLTAALLSRDLNRAELLIRIRDLGPGVSSMERNKLFRPFEQVDGSVARAHGGLGFGLGLAQLAAQRLGGMLWCNTAPGQGAAFYLRLTLALADNQPKELPMKDGAIAEVQKDAPRIVLAIRDLAEQVHLFHQLDSLGFRVEIVGTSTAAVDRLQQGGCQVLILDKDLPGIQVDDLLWFIKNTALAQGRPHLIYLGRPETFNPRNDVRDMVEMFLEKSPPVIEVLSALQRFGYTVPDGVL